MRPLRSPGGSGEVILIQGTGGVSINGLLIAKASGAIGQYCLVFFYSKKPSAFGGRAGPGHRYSRTAEKYSVELWVAPHFNQDLFLTCILSNHYE